MVGVELVQTDEWMSGSHQLQLAVPLDDLGCSALPVNSPSLLQAHDQLFAFNLLIFVSFQSRLNLIESSSVMLVQVLLQGQGLGGN
jgi:hypothetical protein